MLQYVYAGIASLCEYHFDQLQIFQMKRNGGRGVTFEGILGFFWPLVSLKLIFGVNIEWAKASSYAIRGVHMLSWKQCLLRSKTLKSFFPF